MINDSGILDRIKNDTYTNEDIEMINSLPKGTKTFIKYYFGIREKEIKEYPTKNAEECGRERALSTSLKIVPDSLRFQFTPQYAETHNWSDMCCKEFKHGVLAEWERNNGYKYTFTGMRREEGGNRSNLNCITKGSHSIHLNILAPVTDEWEQMFIKKYNVELCELYLPPFNFKRTGCMFCPFSRDLQEQLDTIKMYDYKLYKQANLLWKTTYDEYRRIGYRLRKNDNQMTIFDFTNEENKEK